MITDRKRHTEKRLLVNHQEFMETGKIGRGCIDYELHFIGKGEKGSI